jgi:cell division protein FtsQ
VAVRPGRRAALPPPSDPDDEWQDDAGAYVPRERARRGARWGTFGWWLLAKLVALAVLVGSLALLYQLATSSALYVTEVSVDGLDAVRPEEVIDAAAVGGSHILWINGRQTARRIEQLPAVARARVRPLFPHRVAITVEERKPVARWQLTNTMLLVDEEGRVLGVAKASDEQVVIRDQRDTRGAPPKPGDSVPADAVRAALDLSELLPQEWQPLNGVFDYASDTGISVSTPPGWRVRFGEADELPWKILVLQSLAAEIQRENARVQIIDVRFPGRPYYR